jgi:hypothetical protein
MEQPMNTSTAIPRGSTEYVEATVTIDVTLDMTVELALTRGNNDHTWLPATWEGDPGTTRTARTTVPVTFDDDYPHTAYTLYARLTDTPEEPIIRAGTIYILGTTDTTPLPPAGGINGGTP